MSDSKNRPNIEDAYYFAADCTSPEHRQKLAQYGAVFALVALIGMPLFITIGIPFIASFFG